MQGTPDSHHVRPAADANRRGSKEATGEPVDFDDPAVWVQACEQRAEVLKREMPLALENLAAAQHRDQRRYEYVRKTGYRPRLRKFQVDDVVYLRRQPGDSTDLAVTRGAYRVPADR